MVRPCLGVARALALLVLSVPLGAQRELLRDGTFEKAGKSSSPGWTPVWPPNSRPAPEFSFPNDGAEDGKRCAEVAVEYDGGFSSLTQEVDLPRKVSWVRLSGRTRLEEATGGGSAWLVLAFIGKDESDASLRQTRHVSTLGSWEALALEAAVPEGTTRLMVRCGVFGPARARFDDLSLVGGEGELPRDDVTLVETLSTWRVQAWENVVVPTLDVSVPFPFGSQTPLALEVRSDPPGRVRGLEILSERENRPLRVRLAPLESGSSVALRVRALVLVRRRELPSGEGAELLAVRRLPEEVREFLGPAPGIESEDPRVTGVARDFARKDLARLVEDLLAFLRREIAAGSGDQGALATLTGRAAACTGHANLGAALMIAAGVPTRVLACLLVGHEQEEHYVIESWTRALGWQRIETSVKSFPVADALHVIQRVVYPDAPRSPMHVPLFWRLGEGLTGGPDPEPMGKRGCWQSAKEDAQLALPGGTSGELEDAARAAFEARVGAAGSGDGREGGVLRFLPAEAVPELEARLAAFLAR